MWCRLVVSRVCVCVCVRVRVCKSVIYVIFMLIQCPYSATLYTICYMICYTLVCDIYYMHGHMRVYVCTCVRVYVCTCVRVYVCTCVRVRVTLVH